MKAIFKARDEGLFHIAAFLVPAIGLMLFGSMLHWSLMLLGAVCFALAIFTMYFFRDPNRAVPNDPKSVVSPADGTVVGIEDMLSTPHYDGPCKRVSVFLSVFNVHINRSPFDGIVKSITYKPGKFLNAMGSNTSDLNEANTIRMQTDSGPMTVRQISGLIARRIICKAEVGEILAKGEKFGMIKFGSRTELYLPMDAEICVTLKEIVKGGESVVARFQ
ncbi:MAG: phosphatidylserine decarboxylase family protein [Candidatus Hydrogenedentes bacterium]|nr:phosphatidylserine decarboxylase family protein [Candidatus Hydrogenedentota bacterium]